MLLDPNFNKLDAIIWDAHACPSLSVDADLTPLYTFKENGFTYVSLNVGFEPNSKSELLGTITHITDFINSNHDSFMLVKSINEIIFAKDNNKLAISFDLEGISPLEGDIKNLEIYYHLGVKQITLVYNQNNQYGGGCFDGDLGLTKKGYEFIEEMNRLGILIDCSHVGAKTSLDIINLSKSPVIFSHSNPQKLCAHDRNINDDLIVACAKNNGVIGLNGINIFLANQQSNISNFVDHIDYVVDLVGINHVGLGFDFVFEHEKTLELVARYPEKFPNSEQYKNVRMLSPDRIDEIINELLRRSYSLADIKKIIGDNFFRVASLVWAI